MEWLGVTSVCLGFGFVCAAIFLRQREVGVHDGLGRQKWFSIKSAKVIRFKDGNKIWFYPLRHMKGAVYKDCFYLDETFGPQSEQELAEHEAFINAPRILIRHEDGQLHCTHCWPTTNPIEPLKEAQP